MIHWLPILLFVIVGLAALVLMNFPRRSVHPVGIIALAWWLGIIVSVFFVTLAAVITGRMFFWLLWVFVAAGCGILIWKWKYALDIFRPSPLPEGAKERPKWMIITEYVIALPVLIFAVINAWYVFDIGTSYEIVTLDALGNFALKARLWFTSGLLFPQQLLDPEYLIYKRTYPPIVPMTECLWSYVFGEWSGLTVKYFFFFSWLSVGLLIFAILKKQHSTLTAMIGAGFWAMIPLNITYHYGGAISGFADVPMAMSLLASVLVIGEVRKSQDWRHIILLGICLAGSVWIKKEGLVFWGAVFVYLAWMRAGWRTLAGITITTAVFFVIYKLTTRGLPTFLEYDVNPKLPFDDIMTRIKRFKPEVKDELKHGVKWGKGLFSILLWIWIYKIWRVSWKKWINKELYLFAFMASVLSAVLVFTAHNYHRNFDWAFERLLIQILPLLIVATFKGFDPFCPDAKPLPSDNTDEKSN